MNVYYTLFKAIRELCPKNYKGYFSTLKKNHERVYGVYFKGGAPINRRIDDGKYLTRSANVVFNINASKDVNGVLEGIKFCEDIVKTLEKTYNYIYTDPETGNKVIISSVSVLGDINTLGVNTFDIPTFSLNFIINYAEGGN